MSFLDELRNEVADNARTSGDRKDRKPSKLWLNVVLRIPGAGEDGEDLVVSLPRGIPLDDVEMQRVSGNNANYIKLVQLKNAMLKRLKDKGGKMKPGSNEILTGLEVQIQRVAENAELADESDASEALELINKL